MKKMVSSMCLMLSLSGMMGNSALAASPGEIRVEVNGERLELDQSPVIQEGTTLIPVRGIFEALGAVVQWDAASETVSGIRKVEGEEKSVQLRLQSAKAYANGEEVRLASPAQRIGDRVLVPLRFVSRALGAEVEYDSELRVVRIAWQEANLGTSEQSEGITKQEADRMWVRHAVQNFSRLSSYSIDVEVEKSLEIGGVRVEQSIVAAVEMIRGPIQRVRQTVEVRNARNDQDTAYRSEAYWTEQGLYYIDPESGTWTEGAESMSLALLPASSYYMSPESQLQYWMDGEGELLDQDGQIIYRYVKTGGEIAEMLFGGVGNAPEEGTMTYSIRFDPEYHTVLEVSTRITYAENYHSVRMSFDRHNQIKDIVIPDEILEQAAETAIEN
ncbi:copper amine oxidase N-terminal domain-containing protein [Paenibacillus sp. TRM 82003]|nr:copper amine oxidase N-terminal domain-containing protein [Paenibacillus sp. TRM 82003]